MSDVDLCGLLDKVQDVVAVFDRARRYLHVNAAWQRATGRPAAAVLGKCVDEVMPPADAAAWRAVLDEVTCSGGERMIEHAIEQVNDHANDHDPANEAPQRPRRFMARVTVLREGQLCAVSREIADDRSRLELDLAAQLMATEAFRANQAASYLAQAGVLLERFDPRTSLQAIVDLAVPALADWCFVHLKTAAPGNPELVALAHTDPAKAAAWSALCAMPSRPLSPGTAVARVLAGGPRELVEVDAEVLARAARDPAHLQQLRGFDFRTAVVAPLAGCEGVLGAVTFAMAESGRGYDATDLEMLAELARRTGIALDNARLFAAEQEARRHAEEARDRTRRLQALTVTLSRALTERQVVSIMVDAGRAGLGASAGFAWMQRDDGTLALVASEPAGTRDPSDAFAIIPMTTRLPVCDVVRGAQPMMFESLAAMMGAYPLAVPPRDSPFRAWAIIPFVVDGRGVGAVSFSFERERAFSAEDRALLTAMVGQASLALERARLYETLQRRDEQLQVALRAGRAAPWQLDLGTMIATRDPGYCALLGVRDELGRADFETVHPDDRGVLRAEFERTLREGAPFEPEVRLRRDDGTYLWVRSHGRMMYGPDGRPSVLAGVIVDIDEAKQASLRADQERRINETLHRLGSSFASELDHDRLAQLITDEITRLVGAELGALLCAGGAGDVLAVQAMASGHAAPFRELHAVRALRATPLLTRTLVAHEVVRLDDLRSEPSCSAGATLAEVSPEVRSYLAVPVVAHAGDVFGSLVLGHPEIGRFTAAHERIAASAARQAAVALENARLYQTVRAQKEQLERAIEHARLADRRKDEFLAMLGHELRNPLAPIMTALELMALKASEVLKNERSVIRRQVDHLSRLIDDLLDVSRITRGKIQLTRQVTEVAGVLGKAIEMASPLLERRQQRLAIDVPRDGLLVDVDPTRLAQVFQNLLTNAAKYSGPGSQITLHARGAGDRVVVELADQGIGISAELMPRLFDLFVQGDRALDRAEGGLGIGLTVAKRLCELHGGTLEAASAGAGCGSTFRVTLPRALPGDRAPPAEVHAEVVPVATGMRVLIVDDNLDAAQMLYEFLAALGHEARVAHDGVAALELAGRFKPHVAVLDIGLPVMDGYELARALRGQLGGDTPRLIAVTGYGQDADRVRSRAAGFDHHLVKPIALEALIPLLAAEPADGAVIDDGAAASTAAT